MPSSTPLKLIERHSLGFSSLQLHLFELGADAQIGSDAQESEANARGYHHGRDSCMIKQAQEAE